MTYQSTVVWNVPVFALAVGLLALSVVVVIVGILCFKGKIRALSQGVKRWVPWLGAALFISGVLVLAVGFFYPRIGSSVEVQQDNILRKYEVVNVQFQHLDPVIGGYEVDSAGRPTVEVMFGDGSTANYWYEERAETFEPVLVAPTSGPKVTDPSSFKRAEAG